MSALTFLNGVFIGAALIIAIGAQNMFVIRQGLAKDQVFVVAFTCSVIDGSLIVLGALGLGALISSHPTAITVATVGGALFLITYGSLSLYRFFKPSTQMPNGEGPQVSSTLKAILTSAAFSLLNPHVYLDTVILVGGIAATHEVPDRIYFVAGAITASFVWFFAIAFGARFAAPLMRHPMGARALDLLVAFMMYLVAANLVIDFIASPKNI
ncbi:LysE/ArgO family amino acid transporter [Sneathiella limimaris]|uniref:LysE/ArgO family amino acid transporter n=1 Tax=Sneathiella limimaris TaxID=1964213 RepID=UPI00146DA5C8|nr:LysE/ArgO family amino acid transporter [Sneathiella limimaris]